MKNNIIFNKDHVAVKPPKGRGREGMRIIRRFRYDGSQIFIPEWCIYAHRTTYDRHIQCEQITNENRCMLDKRSSQPARYTQCLCGNSGYTCMNAKYGIYKGYMTAKIIRNIMRYLISKHIILNAVSMSECAQQLNDTLSYYDKFSHKPWKRGKTV